MEYEGIKFPPKAKDLKLFLSYSTVFQVLGYRNMESVEFLRKYEIISWIKQGVKIINFALLMGEIFKSMLDGGKLKFRK